MFNSKLLVYQRVPSAAPVMPRGSVPSRPHLVAVVAPSAERCPTGAGRSVTCLERTAQHVGKLYPIGSMMDPINIPQMLAYIPYMDPMGMDNNMCFGNTTNTYKHKLSLNKNIVKDHKSINFPALEHCVVCRKQTISLSKRQHSHYQFRWSESKR